jgi:putative membrane protein
MNKTTLYSLEQVLLSSERTALAWTRTSTALMAFGFVIEKFGLDMLGVEVKADTLRYSLLLGVFFIVLGAAVAFFAIYQYHVILNSVNVRKLPRGYSTRVVQIINFMVGVFGLLLAAGILSGLQ